MDYLNELRKFGNSRKHMFTSQGEPWKDHVFGAFSFAYYIHLINVDEYNLLLDEFFPL